MCLYRGLNIVVCLILFFCIMCFALWLLSRVCVCVVLYDGFSCVVVGVAGVVCIVCFVVCP